MVLETHQTPQLLFEQIKLASTHLVMEAVTDITKTIQWEAVMSSDIQYCFVWIMLRNVSLQTKLFMSVQAHLF